MAHIFSLQSHVVYGYAGNTAAVFPMQRLGHRVSILNLLQFSNHTGYGSWGGQAISVSELQEVLRGLEKINALDDIAAVVSGYIGSIEQAYLIRDFIVKLKKQHPKLIYCCDPVMGDDGRGIYVKPTIAEFIQTEMIKIADWMTPNAFELSLLAQSSIKSREDALLACKKLLKQLPSLQGILATSISTSPLKTGMLLVTRNSAYHSDMPKYALPSSVHGTGDVTTAIFLSHLLHNETPEIAMQKTANTLHAMVKYTYDHELTELSIIPVQKKIEEPDQLFLSTDLG